MTKSTWIALAGSALMFLVLFYGFERKSEDVLNQEKNRLNQFVTLDVNNLMLSAEAEMDEELVAEMRLLRKEVEQAANDSLRIEQLKILSRKWYQQGRFGIAGHFAEQIAELTGTETAWSIAATTYSLGLVNKTSSQEKKFCARKSTESYEKAISLNPEELSHRLNMAVSQVEYAMTGESEDNMMQGIMTLRQMAEDHPSYVPVKNALARLGMLTGQFEKALNRLLAAEKLEPNNSKTICLLADVYKQMNNNALALEYGAKCEKK